MRSVQAFLLAQRGAHRVNLEFPGGERIEAPLVFWSITILPEVAVPRVDDNVLGANQ